MRIISTVVLQRLLRAKTLEQFDEAQKDASRQSVNLSQDRQVLVLHGIKKQARVALVETMEEEALLSLDDTLIETKQEAWLLIGSEGRQRERVDEASKYLSKDTPLGLMAACVSFKSSSIYELGLALRVAKHIVHIQRQNQGPTIATEYDTAAQLFALPAIDDFTKRQLVEKITTPIHRDRVLLRTAQAMLDANLSAARAAKILNVHRNTLLYRLNKIKHLSGLDLSKFSHAKSYFVCLLALQLQ